MAFIGCSCLRCAVRGLLLAVSHPPEPENTLPIGGSAAARGAASFMLGYHEVSGAVAPGWVRARGTPAGDQLYRLWEISRLVCRTGYLYVLPFYILCLSPYLTFLLRLELLGDNAIVRCRPTIVIVSDIRTYLQDGIALCLPFETICLLPCWILRW